MLFRFVSSQRDILPPGQCLLFFLFCRDFCTKFENEHPASFSFFMPEHGKGGLFFSNPDGHGNRKEKQNHE